MSEEGFIQFKGRTAWGRYSLDQIWAMVAHEDGTLTAAQVQSWRRMADLCQDQANALEKAVGQLFHRWPPRPGTAAAAFQLRIRNLIASMRDSANHASAMPDPLWKITNQLTMTRYDVLELLQQRAATEAIERSQDPIRGYNGKAGGRPEPDALPTNWRDQFDQRARQIMSITESVVSDAAAQFHPPTRFLPPGGVGERGEPVDPDADGSSGGGPQAWPSSQTSLVAGLSPSVGPSGPLTQSGGAIDPPTSHDGPTLAGSTASPPDQGSHLAPSLGQATTASFSGSPGGIVLAPGGVIGGSATSTGPANTTPTLPQRMQAGALNTQAQGPMVTPMGGRPTTSSAGTTGGVRPSGRRRFRKDSEEPWGGGSGVPAVLEPGPESTHHDPGPGVLGLDR